MYIVYQGLQNELAASVEQELVVMEQNLWIGMCTVEMLSTKRYLQS